MDLNGILMHFYQLSHICVCHYQRETELSRYGEPSFSQKYEQDLRAQFLESGEQYCYQITPEFLLYAFLRLNNPDEYLLIGPALRDDDLHATVSRLSSAFHCWEQQSLWDYVRKLPVIDFQNFLACLQTLYMSVLREALCSSADMFYLLSSHVPPMPLSLQEEMSVVRNQTVERRMLSCIEYGKAEELKKVLKFDVRGSDFPEYYGISLIRSYQNVFIAATALCSRAAMRGGMNYDAAIEASDVYIRRVEKMRTPSEIDAEFGRMALFYAEQTAAVRLFADASTIVKNTISYIRAHLCEKITVNDIADALRQNPSYLSHHFKEQTGSSISSYVVQEKINEAKRLLRASELSLSRISTTLGFSSQQYFQSVFKKQTGFTPTEYRKAGEV